MDLPTPGRAVDGDDGNAHEPLRLPARRDFELGGFACDRVPELFEPVAAFFAVGDFFRTGFATRTGLAAARRAGSGSAATEPHPG